MTTAPMNSSITTAVIALAGTAVGGLLTFANGAFQAYLASKAKQLDLEQTRAQAYADHINQRREQRRSSYLAFMETVSALLALTREDRYLAAANDVVAYTQRLHDSAAAIEAARDAVVLDGPQDVGTAASELTRLPYRLAQDVVAVLEAAPDSRAREAAVQEAEQRRNDLLRHHAYFMLEGSKANNDDGVGNYTGPSPV